MSTFNEVPHPGLRIRAEVIPPKMTVVKASELIGVGRPALSNLLNGKASLSPDMAMRIEKAFGTPRKNLLEMQAEYDAFKAIHRAPPQGAKAYVPPFLSFRANDIENWVSHNITARSRLAVFLRTLVHSTGNGLSKVDFPGNDDAERAGWDGITEAGEESAWVPAKRSGWELGTNEKPKQKADKDYRKSVDSTTATEQAETVFIFVTPRSWPGKNDWVASKKAEGKWRDVRAYDSSDLEQWLAQSLPAQAWFASETKVPAEHVRSLDRCWTDWANVATPSMPGKLFTSAIEEAKRRKLMERLSKPPIRPIIIAADSTDEALAFIAQFLNSSWGDGLEQVRDRVLVFDKPGILPRLAEGLRSFIPVIHSRDVEAELAPYATKIHSIVVYPRNCINVEPDLVLEPVGYDVFESALKEIGKNRDEITNLAKESGRSLTVLRRRLATVQAVQMPLWTARQQEPERLIPFMLVGAWQALNETDMAGLSLLSRSQSPEDLEIDCQRLTQLDDAPLWSIGSYRGVVSKIDLLYAIARYLTRDDLKRYFDVARMVLNEDDPSLDLAEEQRWAATIYGKTREFSTAFRQGVSETLVLLAVHGGHLFKERLPCDTESEVALVVRDLLKFPLTTRKLEANNRDLPLYAEAAPNEFLSIIERDLKTENPAVFGLMRPAGSGIFGSPSRTGLLWALEGLAWNPDTLTRTALILARLAQIEINDNWVNKPERSLAAIFRAWMPQTAASNQERLALMRTLFSKFPDVAWTICLAQFGNRHQIGEYSHKPMWRPDGYGHGEPFSTLGPVLEFVGEMVEQALTRGNYSLSMLCDLIDRLHDLIDADQDRVWRLVEVWSATASDRDKVTLREKIRVSTLSRLAALRFKKSGKSTRVATAAKGIYAALEPSSLVDRYAWLFKGTWIEESADELENIENIDYEERDRRIRDQRIQAIKAIHGKQGVSGLLDLVIRGGAPREVGVLSTNGVLGEEELLKLVLEAFRLSKKDETSARALELLIQGVLGAILEDEKRTAFIKSLISILGAKNAVPLLILAPFKEATWSLVRSHGEPQELGYWEVIDPSWLHDSPSTIAKAVGMLMKVRRPRAAFALVKYNTEKLPVRILFELLTAMAQGGDDKPGDYMLEHYHVEEAFKRINTASELSLEQKAGLEFAYIDVLTRTWERRSKSGIPNLERYVDDHPEVVVQAIVWAYKRMDREDDPPEFKVPADNAKSMAERGYSLLEVIQRIPGSDEQGEIDADKLVKWVNAVRDACLKLSRVEIADVVIGKILSAAPTSNDGTWPCEAVRKVMEEIQSEDMMSGAHSGVYNSRGVHTRGIGGDQERQIADKYRKWAQQVRTSSPFVASKLLLRIAETYEKEAFREDTEAKLNRRLR